MCHMPAPKLITFQGHWNYLVWLKPWLWWPLNKRSILWGRRIKATASGKEVSIVMTITFRYQDLVGEREKEISSSEQRSLAFPWAQPYHETYYWNKYCMCLGKNFHIVLGCYFEITKIPSWLMENHMEIKLKFWLIKGHLWYSTVDSWISSNFRII